ncbi:GMC oxidoreductase [Pseudomonas shahriarae]|uniref:GMC oxidoreductase n=1 Tax=Pseudomonas shahriarae TaxID=2745512 RepID=A0A9X4C476_9PSED|nr:GMC oxidoreductase [Pseudomonas shahriarae]MDD1009922.1 GMC oxidoreductase [Pseudomonas shahriarae]
MTPNFDVIIVGSGPAGTSAAYPLVQAGLRVLMLDPASGQRSPDVPKGKYLTNRANETKQWEWMIGKSFHALNNMEAVSPKLKTPTHEQTFKKFNESNGLITENFISVGSLATGGLSNAWGCGVARFPAEDFAGLGIEYSDIATSYGVVARRMGISGNTPDDLSDYFGVDEWAQEPIAMDKLHDRLLTKYNKLPSTSRLAEFRMGRSRVAALSEDMGDRKACDLSGNCLWGCHNNALYSAEQEIPKLNLYPGFHHMSGVLVDGISKEIDGWVVTSTNSGKKFSAKRLLLAAGTLTSTKLALGCLQHTAPVPLQASPTAAFLLWLPKMLGTPRKQTLGLGQLSFSLDLSPGITAFGSTFSTTGLPMSEFVSRAPLSKRYSIELMAHLLSSCVVGNVFLPGHLSNHTATLTAEGILKIKGAEHADTNMLMKKAETLLRKAYWKLGAVLMPMSFTVGKPGADIHYSATLPMSASSKAGTTSNIGEVVGLAGLHIVDGAVLPKLTEKSHTLTIMANADRIARVIASKMHLAS